MALRDRQRAKKRRKREEKKRRTPEQKEQHGELRESETIERAEILEPSDLVDINGNSDEGEQMKIWIRVYPAIELEGSPESITHNLSAAAILSMSVYRTEGQAREAAKKYGGLVIETIADLLKDDAIEKDGGGFYLSGSDEGNYIVGDPQLPTSVSCVVVAGSQRIVSEGREGNIQKHRTKTVNGYKAFMTPPR